MFRLRKGPDHIYSIQCPLTTKWECGLRKFEYLGILNLLAYFAERAKSRTANFQSFRICFLCLENGIYKSHFLGTIKESFKNIDQNQSVVTSSSQQCY